MWLFKGPIVSFNGLGFDFRALAEEIPERYEKIQEMAQNHIDPGFQMFCEKGFMCGLDAAAKGMEIEGKKEGISGAKAPTMWKMGRAHQAQVMSYVAQDARATAALYKEILLRGELVWVKKDGMKTRYPWEPTVLDGRLLTCAEAMRLPLPDTSWMDEPWDREKFWGWTQKEGE